MNCHPRWMVPLAARNCAPAFVPLQSAPGSTDSLLRPCFSLHSHCPAQPPAKTTCNPLHSPWPRHSQGDSNRPGCIEPRRNSARRLCDTTSPPLHNLSPPLCHRRSKGPDCFGLYRHPGQPLCATTSQPRQSPGSHPPQEHNIFRDSLEPVQSPVRQICETTSPLRPGLWPRPRRCSSKDRVDTRNLHHLLLPWP